MSRSYFRGPDCSKKLEWIEPVTVPGDWLMVESIQRCVDKEAKARNKQWATMQCIVQLCKLAKSPREWEITALSALSIALGLRACEAITMQPDDPNIHFMRAKDRRGPHSEQLAHGQEHGHCSLPASECWGDITPTD